MRSWTLDSKASPVASRRALHPLSGQQFELVGYVYTWGEHRVFFRRPGDERVHSIPAGWTDVEGIDPYAS
jgi:hypothetical protein